MGRYKAVVFAPWFGPVRYTRPLQKSIDRGQSLQWVIPSDQPRCITGSNVVWVHDTLDAVSRRASDALGVAVNLLDGYHLCDLRGWFPLLWPEQVGHGLWGWQDWDTESRLDDADLAPDRVNVFAAGWQVGPLVIAPAGALAPPSLAAHVAGRSQALDEYAQVPAMIAQYGRLRHIGWATHHLNLPEKFPRQVYSSNS